jgi:hypothetical protein
MLKSSVFPLATPELQRYALRNYMNQIIWEKAKKYILPYNGGASQIHILAIPKTNIKHICNVIRKSVNNPKLYLLSSEPLNEDIELDDAINASDIMKKMQYGQSAIKAKIFKSAEITFDIWFEKSKDTFDLEIWFWADQFFPGEEKLNYSRFNELLSILSVLSFQGAYRSILTPCEASDPMEDLKKGYGIEIKLNGA